MELNHIAVSWAKQYRFDAIQIDCATTLMLKILDGKCKMNREEKRVMMLIYDVVKHQPGKLLDSQVHALIDLAREGLSENLVETIYEQRLYAEQMISRAVMKSYKSMLRREGILE